MKASDFKVGDRVRDTDVEGAGLVTEVTDSQVAVLFDADPNAEHPADQYDQSFTFDEGIDLHYLEKING